MRFSSGFIMLPRGLRGQYFQHKGIDFSVYTYILENAQYCDEPSYIDRGGRYTYEVNEGEFLTTKIDLANQNGITPRQLSPILSRLKRLKLLTERRIYNSSIFKINPEVWLIVRNPLVNRSSLEGSTNKKRKKKKEEYNIISKDIISSKKPKNLSKDFDDEGTPSIFKTQNDLCQDSKNTPPNDLEGSGSTLTPSRLLELWNEHSGALPKCRSLSKGRIAKCKLRLKENSDKNYWIDAIKKLSNSDFAIEGKWASFDWIIKNSENHDKAAAGNYDNKKKSGYNVDLQSSSVDADWFFDE